MTLYENTISDKLQYRTRIVLNDKKQYWIILHNRSKLNKYQK